MGPIPTEEIIHPTHTIMHPFQISQFSSCIKEISIPHFYVLQTSYHQIQTRFHCSSVHSICSVAKSRWTFWFFLFLNERFATWNQATNFSLFNLRETVVLEIGFPVSSQNVQEIDVAVLKWSFKDILTIIQSSCLVVIRSLSVLFWLKSLVSFKSTDNMINNAFWPSYDASNFRIRFAFMIC